MPAGTEPPEPLGIAVLSHPGPTVAAVIIGVDDESGIHERGRQRPVSPGVFTHTVEDVDDTAGCRAGLGDVVDDRDAVRVDELGHGAEPSDQHEWVGMRDIAR